MTSITTRSADPTAGDEGGEPTVDPAALPVVPRWAGAAAGLVAGAVGLGAAEVAAAASRRLRSPVLDVGDRVIDRVPAWLKNLAIEWFGTRDKQALLIGIAVILAVAAALIGLLGRRDRRLGDAGVAVFGLVGGWAALAARVERPWWTALPAVAGAVVAGLTLRALLAVGTRPTTRRSPGVDTSGDTGLVTEPTAAVAEAEPWRGGGRRRFLIGAAASSVLAVGLARAGRGLQRRFDVAADRLSLRLPRARNPLPPIPAAASVDVPGMTPFVTPNADFYRIDTALSVPRIDVETWRLRIVGMVDRPLELGWDDLVGRDIVEADITMTCVSNEIGGGLVGNARWLGCRLDDLLAEAGVDPAADQVVGRSVDGYTCGFPVAALDGRDALVAIGMNGEPLPLEHGYPARLIVPGLYGYVSATKWLTEIELTRFDAFDQYWVPRGWDAQAPIKTMSRIDTPAGLASLAPGTVAVAGVAWAQTRGIRAVQVRVDEGDWIDADLAEAVGDDTWRQWSWPWDATPGRHTLEVRAIDTTGDVQTDERRPPMPNGASGHHQIVVLVADE